MKQQSAIKLGKISYVDCPDRKKRLSDVADLIVNGGSRIKPGIKGEGETAKALKNSSERNVGAISGDNRKYMAPEKDLRV